MSSIKHDQKDLSASPKLDYITFQERVMGKEYRLRFHEPINQIMYKQIEGSKSSQCEMQYLRLWQCGVRQTMMFFANMSSNKYKEYNSKSA